MAMRAVVQGGNMIYKAGCLVEGYKSAQRIYKDLLKNERMGHGDAVVVVIHGASKSS